MVDAELTVTDSAWDDVGFAVEPEGDFAMGEDENDFVASFSSPRVDGGELVYIEGTPFGGVVDSVARSSTTDLLEAHGRTWTGMLAGKVLRPPSGSDHLTVSGDLNTVISQLLGRVSLSPLFAAPAEPCGISVTNYRFERFVSAYNAMRAMCSSVGAALRVRREGGVVWVYAEEAPVWTGEADSDLMSLEITSSHTVVNHLVCLGEGEMQARVVVDLYANRQGRISQTQTLFGADEVADIYEYTAADRTELIKKGTERLQEAQTDGSVRCGLLQEADWQVDDLISAYDAATDTSVTAPVTKVVAKLSMGVLSVEHDIGKD